MSDHREPPTAVQPSRDLSGSRDRASTSPAGRSPQEHALFHGYRYPAPTMVEQPCACGGAIIAIFGDWGSIAGAIRLHQELMIHQIWRDRQAIA